MLDDEPYFIAAYKDVLELEGFEVLLTQSEEEFLTALKSVLPQAVVIDIMLQSGYDAGFELYNRFRRSCPDVPAILLTNREDIRTGNIIDKLTKILLKRDITPMDLYDSIDSLLEKGSATKQAKGLTKRSSRRGKPRG